ncbi:hypothetical protein R1sor_016049 [Riccia sorocarpa]|uniref:Reverse transcriptase domain-containing protein n=1 Tax=Riccia sorocarpa TaxID=122646 RepID=A0ABD3HHC8_9MARC
MTPRQNIFLQNSRLNGLGTLSQENEDGEVLSEREEILDEIHGFYQQLYTAEAESEAKKEAREELVGLIHNKLDRDESTMLSRTPESQEIESVVFGMGANKAPGQNGLRLTVEILKMCWSFVGEDCVRFVQTVWAKKRILPSDCQGIIRLIHKSGDRKLLGNWRPISLMSLSYKIVTKILANRLRGILPKLVDPQQNGFVQGRQITDNVMSLKLGQEWAHWSDQTALFVKIDFVKAYDRIDHSFLWRTLEEFGFGPEFVALVQGCTRGRTARVHADGAFSQARESDFSELESILARYEVASRARMNMAKSLVMPLGSESCADWVRSKGCVIIERDQTFKYLGVRVGTGNTDSRAVMMPCNGLKSV